MPDAGHLTHMPSHIDAWVGQWKEGIDCNCATDNSTCTHYDPRARKNATHWYCQDVPRGNQLSLDGELYGGRYGTSGLE